MYVSHHSDYPRGSQHLEEQLQIKDFSDYLPNIYEIFFTFVWFFIALGFCVRTQEEENEQRDAYQP